MYNKAQSLPRETAILCVSEMGIGSLLHAFRIPLAGQFLSLNQIFLLSRVSLNKVSKTQIWMPFKVSALAALFKSISPAGKKLTPMLAISAQGFLFNLGSVVLGRNLLGLCLGSILSGLWAFLQPLILFYIFYGNLIVSVSEYYFKKTLDFLSLEQNTLFLILCGFVILKIILSLAMVLLARFVSEKTLDSFEKNLFVWASKSRTRNTLDSGVALKHKEVMKKAIRDTFNPLFIFSLILTGVFLFYAEASKATVVWAILRPIAVAFVVFYIVRLLPFDKWTKRFGLKSYLVKEQVKTLIDDVDTSKNIANSGSSS